MVTMLVINYSYPICFGSIGTLLGAAKQSGMIDENREVIHMKQALMSDASPTAAGAMVGTSTVTAVVESSAGIAAEGQDRLKACYCSHILAAIILFSGKYHSGSGLTAPALIFVKPPDAG